MLKQPRKFKFKKEQKGRIKGFELSKTSNRLYFGLYGLKILNSGYITSNQIEATRQIINRTLKRQGKIWIRFFPDKPITKKPLETRMGKGKGNVNHWVARIKNGKILFEISGVSKELAYSALLLGAAKLPFKTKIIIRN